MSEEAVYSKIQEANELIVALQTKYPDLFWAIRPDNIAVMGIENKTRSDKAKAKSPFYAKLVSIKGSEKTIMQLNNVDTRYIIEMYWDEWRDWKESRKQWILADQILRISPDIGKTVQYDCSGFKVLLDKIGVTALSDYTADLPNMIISDIEFNLDLRPGIDEAEAEAGKTEKAPPPPPEPELSQEEFEKSLSDNAPVDDDTDNDDETQEDQDDSEEVQDDQDDSENLF